VLQQVADGLAIAWEAVSLAWVSTWSYISEQMGLAVEVISSLLSGDFMGAVSLVGEMIGNHLQVISNAFTGLWSLVQPALVQFAADAAAWATALPEKIGAGLSQLGAVVAERFSGLGAAVGEKLTLVAADALISAGEIVVSVGQGLTGLPDHVAAAVSAMGLRLAQEIKAVAQVALAKAKEIGDFLIDGITAGIDAKWQALKTKVNGLADIIPDWMRKALKIHSPSRVMREIGEFVVDGLVVGVGRGAGELQDTSEELAGSMTSVFQDMAGDIASTFGDLFVGLGNGAAGAIDAVKSTLQRGLSNLVSSNLQQGFSSIFSGAGSAASASVAAASPAAGGLLGGLGSAGGILGSLGGAGGILSGIGGAVSTIGQGLASGFMTALNGGLGGAVSGGLSVGGLSGLSTALGAVAVPLLAITAAISFFKKKVTLLDGGLRVTTDGMESLIDTFKKEEIKRFWGLSKKEKTSYAAADADVADPIAAIIGDMQQGVLALTGVLGVGAGAFDDFAHEVTVSTKGLSEEDAQQAVIEALQGVGNAFAALTPNLAQFVREGEESGEALTRIVSDLSSVNLMMDTLGHRLMDVSVIGAGTASNFAALFGGVDAMNAVTTAFYQGFYSEAERFDTATRQVNAQFAALNISMPQSRAEFRALVEGLDTTTVAGRETYAALLSMSGALDAVLPAVASFTAEIAAMGLNTTSLIDGMVSDTGALMQASETAATLWYRTANTLRDFIADLRSTASQLVTGSQAKAFSEARFQALLASAIGGDNEAASDLTAAARTLLQNTESTARTALEVARGEARVLGDLQLASGVSDVEGARHDAIAGLLGQQVDLLGTVRDAINSGDALSPSDISGLNGQLGALENAIAAAEMINYSFLRERLAVTVDLLATSSIPQELRKLLQNAQTGVEGSIDFLVRSDLDPDQKWLALTGSSEHIKTIDLVVGDLLDASTARIALGAASTLTKTVDLQAGRLLDHNTAWAAVTTVSSLAKTVNLIAGQQLTADQMRVALAGNSELSRVVNVSLASGASAQAMRLALGNVNAYTVTVGAALQSGLSEAVKRVVVDQQGTYATLIEAGISGDLLDWQKRVLLDRQGSYVALIGATLASGIPEAYQSLLLNGITNATRAVTILAAFDSAITPEQRVLLAAQSSGITKSITGAVGFTEMTGIDWDLFHMRNHSVQKGVVGRAAFVAMDDQKWRLFNMGNHSVLKGVLGESAFTGMTADKWRLFNMNDHSVRKGVVGRSMFVGMDAEKWRLLNMNDHSVRKGVVGRSMFTGMTADNWRLFDMDSNAISKTISGAVDLSKLNSKQSSFFNAITGASAGTITLGGGFQFDPSTAFQTWFGGTTFNNMATPLNSVRTGLDQLVNALNTMELRTQLNDVLTDQRKAEEWSGILMGKVEALKDSTGVQLLNRTTMQDAQFGFNGDGSAIFNPAENRAFGKSKETLAFSAVYNADDGLYERMMRSIEIWEEQELKAAALRAQIQSLAAIPAYATGTTFHAGGLARINDGKGGEILDLPNGTRVYPADESRQMMKASGSGLNAELRALRRELSEMKAQNRAIGKSQISASMRTADVLEKFDMDGLPEGRT
jgi:hypothetical protein